MQCLAVTRRPFRRRTAPQMEALYSGENNTTLAMRSGSREPDGSRGSPAWHEHASVKRKRTRRRSMRFYYNLELPCFQALAVVLQGFFDRRFSGLLHVLQVFLEDCQRLRRNIRLLQRLVQTQDEGACKVSVRTVGEDRAADCVPCLCGCLPYTEEFLPHLLIWRQFNLVVGQPCSNALVHL